MAAKYRIVPRSRAQLEAMASPENARQPESLPWVLYDTQPFVNATTTSLAYYTTQQSDKTLGNMEGSGALPDPQYFEVMNIGMDLLNVPFQIAAATAVGPINDLALLLHSARATFEINVSNKRTGPFPATFLHASGGPTGFGYGTFTAPGGHQWAVNGIFDGGYNVGGSIIFKPKVGFDVTLRFAAVQTLNVNNQNLRIWMQGVLHRAVL
jgi:hypothetical protein